MSNRTCKNCNKIFRSVQGLIKHKSKKIPCEPGENLTCDKCGMTFKKKYHLTRHSNRKTPCVKQNISLFLKEQKEIIQLKVEAEIKILEKKREIIELQYETKKNLIEIQKQKDLALEEQKFKRKKSVSHQTTINNIMHQININMPAVNKIPATYNNCIEEIVEPFIKRIANGSYNSYELIYESGLSKAEIATRIIQDVFQNETMPNSRNIIYVTEQDLFMVVLHKAWVHKQFNYIAKIMTETFKLCFTAILTRIGKPLRCNFISNNAYTKALQKYTEVNELANIDISAEELEQISRDGLSIDDIMSGKRLIMS
jgi:uncharacterized C2H2 Zn-finger protein